MQCQFGIFLKDSLTFLLGDLKKRKIYNIFRFLGFFFLVTPQPTTWHDPPRWRMPMVSLSGDEQGDGGRGGFLFFF